jgi:hypothetical protein
MFLADHPASFVELHMALQAVSFQDTSLHVMQGGASILASAPFLLELDHIAHKTRPWLGHEVTSMLDTHMMMPSPPCHGIAYEDSLSRTSHSWKIHVFLMSFSCDCAKSGFASHFEWQLQNVIAPSISNGLPCNLISGISHMLSRFP